MENTVICLQEHFLWDCQKNEISKLIPTMTNFTRCSDSNEPISNFKLPRGHAGVSILWPSELNSKIKKLPDGNERIIAITISCLPELLIINAYMPTINTDSQLEYAECLDIISDIVTKYRQSYQIIICGDLNATLLDSRNNKHDRLLKDFIQEHGFHKEKRAVDKPTFYHHANGGTSQIDYRWIQTF